MKKHTRTNFGLKTGLSFSVGLTALIAGSGLTAMAQEEGDEEAKRLNTVTITATKREQTLQDVPVAVSVVDDSVIEKAEIQDLGDLQSLVPSLTVGQLQSSANTNFIIRGFGNGANNAGIEPSVGVFIDGVYRSRSAAQISDLPNLQRVEVLRGPQSTLFGKNASAGVISIVTRGPQFEQGGSVEAGIGNFNAYRLKGDITGPLSDTVAYSLSGNYNKRDGYADDLATGSDVNQRDRWGLRGQLLFEPNEDLSFRVIGDYDKIDEICCVAGNLVNGPTGAAIGLLGGQIDAEDPFSYEVFNNFDSTNDIENSGISLQADYALPFADLTSITSFRTVDSVTDQDSDFTSADLVERNLSETNIETFTQEVRLTSNNPDAQFDWMVGAFFFDEQVEVSNEFFYGADFRAYADILAGDPAALAGTELFAGVPVGTFGAQGQGPIEEFGQDNTSWSLFGTVDFYVTDRLTATVGVNYTEDEKDAFGRATNTDVLSALDLTQLGYTAVLASLLGDVGVDITNPASVGPFVQANPALYGQLQAGAAAAAQDPTLNPFGALAPLQFLPPFLNFPNAVESGSSSDSNTSYTLRLAYDLTDNINVYGSYATGFKATSWNLSRDSRPFPADFTAGSNIVDPVTGQVVVTAPSSNIQDAGLATTNLIAGTRFAGPEEAEVFELGVKGSFSNFAFNLAVFDQVIEGFQSNVFTGTGFQLLNAGEQSTQGIEFDATWNPTDALTIIFATTLLDPVYDSFPDSASGDLSGTTPSGIPETSTSLGFNYDFTVANWDSFIRADWQYASNTDFFDDAANQALLDSVGYTREVNNVNASLGFVSENGLGVTFWSRNLFDDERITTAFPSVAQAGSLSGYPSQPRTYGVTVRKTF
ncbi:MAG: TonB-dependent receptor [Pseudomonadota bacterium]